MRVRLQMLFAATCQVPENDALVECGQLLAVLTESRAEDLKVVSKTRSLTAGIHVPDPQRTIETSGNQTLAAGAECQMPHDHLMAGKGALPVAGASIPR